MHSSETSEHREELPELPLERACPYHPPAGYETLRRRGPVTRVRMFDGRPVWAVTGHTAVRSLLANQDMSVDRLHANYPMPTPALAQLRDSGRPTIDALLRTDPPDHSRQRRDVLPSFALRKVMALKPTMQKVVDAQITAMTRQGCAADLVSAFARPTVTRVMTELLGIPEQDQHHFEKLSYRMFDPVNAMTKYLGELLRAKEIQAKETERGEGLLDDLVGKVMNDALDRDELIRYALALVIAGQDITVNTIVLSVLTLLQHPEQLAQLRAEPDLWPNAVEELLRFLSLTGGLARVATADVVIDGQTIRAGDGIILLNPDANRDEEHFERPDELDVRRTIRNHLTFGFGIHQCIGQNLARFELEIALRTLFDRLPSLSLTIAMEDLPVKQGAVFGLASLPVAW